MNRIVWEHPSESSDVVPGVTGRLIYKDDLSSQLQVLKDPEAEQAL